MLLAVAAVLASVSIPAGVTEIGRCAFYQCGNLATVSLGSGLTSIDEWTFYDCSSLDSIAIPDEVTEIDQHAFSGCHHLASITIPDGVKTIAPFAFANCFNLKNIFCQAINPPECNFSFGETDKQVCTLYVPQGTAEAYKSAYEWKDFSHIVEMDFSGSEEAKADAEAAVRVYASAGGLTIANADAGTPIDVYTAAGVPV